MALVPSPSSPPQRPFPSAVSRLPPLPEPARAGRSRAAAGLAALVLAAGGCSSSSPAGKAPPTPPGPTTTIGPAGGALDATTPEGATVHLAVPANALAGDVVFTIGAQAAGPGESLRVALSPPGLVFKVPATLTVVRPGGTFPADTILSALSADGTGRVWFPTTVSADGKTLTAALRLLGASPAPPSAAAAAEVPRLGTASTRASPASVDVQAFLLVAASLPIDQLLGELHTHVLQLIADARFDDAVVLSLGARVLIDRLGTDTAGWSGAEQQFWADLKNAVCSGQTATISRVSAIQPQCVWQSREPAKDLLGSMALEQQLGIACSDGESNTPWGALDALLQRTLTFVQNPANRAAFVACECNDPARLAAERDGSRRRPPECGAAPAGLAALPAPAHATPAGPPALYDRTTAGYEWKLLLETVTLTADDFTPLRVMEYTNDAERATARLGGGVVDAARRFAFSLCLDNQDSSILEALWRRVGALEAPLSDVTAGIRSDAQWCGASLHVVAEKADHSQAAVTDIARPTGPGLPEPEGSIIAPPDGKLFLTGPIATLRCRDPGTMETISLAADELSFRTEDGALSHGMGYVQANRADDVLGTATPFQVQVGFELGALNLPSQDSSFDVVLERSGGGCGFDAPEKNEVMRLHVSTDLPITFTLGGVNDHFPGDPARTGSLGVVPANGALLVAKVLRGDVPVRDKTVVFRKHDYATGSATDVATLTTDPWGEATASVPRPGEGTYDSYYAFWSQDGRDCPDPYAGGAAPPKQCHVATLGLYPTVGITVSGPASVDKGGTYRFTAVVNAGTSQGVTWAVDGLGTIGADGTFTAGQVAGDFTVTATSTQSVLTGTGKGHVRLSNVDYLGTWSGTSTIVQPTSVFTAPDGNQYIAGHPYSECSGSTLSMYVSEGNGISAPVGKLAVLFNPCGDGTMVGQANDRYFYVGSPSNVCEDLVMTTEVTYTTGGGATTMHGTVEIFDCRTTWSWVTREFQLTRAP